VCAAGDPLAIAASARIVVADIVAGLPLANARHLIYGSEHLCAIAAGLSERTGRDYRQVLKGFGVPTVFRMKLPLEWVNEHDLGQLVDLLHEWIPWVRRNRTRQASTSLFGRAARCRPTASCRISIQAASSIP